MVRVRARPAMLRVAACNDVIYLSFAMLRTGYELGYAWLRLRLPKAWRDWRQKYLAGDHT